MATKDVRVRLSAEGTAEVIAAFRKVQEETDRTNRSAKTASREGLADLKNAAHSLALEYIGLESAMKVFEVLKRAVETTVEYATGIEKAAQKTGFAAETLQVYGVAAQQIGIDQEVVTKGLIKFQKSMGDLETGTAKTANAIKELFGNKDALKGLPDEARLQKVTEALARMEPGAKRTSISIALFGKAGAELLPVIDELGAAGFDVLKQKLESYGVALDENAIRRMRQAEAAMADVKLAAKGVQIQFTEGLAPALADISEGLAKNIGPDGWKGFGAAAGDAVKSVILFLGALAIQLREVYDKIIVVVRAWVNLEPGNLGRLVADKGSIKKALGSIVDTAKAEWDTATANSVAAIQNLGQLVAEKVPAIVKNVRSTSGDADSVKAATESNAARERLLRARVEFDQAVLNDELAIFKESARLEGEQERAKYEAGLESLQTYFANRRKAADDDNAREVAILIQRRDALAAIQSKNPADEIRIQAELLAVDSKIQVLKTQGAEVSFRLAREEGDAQKKNAAELLGFEEKILVAQGRRHEAEARKIDEEMRKYAEALRQAGVAEDEIIRRVATAGGARAAENDFAELKSKVEAGLASLAEARSDIENAAAAGAMSQTQATRELHRLDLERLPTLRELVAEMQALAKSAGLPQLTAETDQWSRKLNDADTALVRVKGATKDATETFERGLGRSLETFFTAGITHARSFGDAVRGLAMSVVADMQKMFLTLIENMIRAKIEAKIADSGGDGGGFLGFLSGMMGKKAGGGTIEGPGGIDRVPTWLTAGEFVVKEPVARQPGVRALLSAINDGMPTPALRAGGLAFARGGLVEGGFSLEAKASNPEAQMTVGLDYGLVLKQISAHPDFGRVIIKHLDLNRKAANAALGVKA